MASSMLMLYIWQSQFIACWTWSCMWPTLWMLFCSFRRILYLPAAERLLRCSSHQHTTSFAIYPESGSAAESGLTGGK